MIQPDGTKRLVKYDYLTDKNNNCDINDQQKIELTQDDIIRYLES